MSKVLIGIAQESGKVDRLQNLKTFSSRPTKYYGDKAKSNLEEGELIADKAIEDKSLKDPGFNFNTGPSADLWVEPVQEQTFPIYRKKICFLLNILVRF